MRDIWIGKNTATQAVTALNILGANASAEGIAATVQEMWICD